LDFGPLMNTFRTLRRTKIGRILLFLFGSAALLFIVLFTPLGNRLTAPVVEKALSSALSTPISISDFALSYNRFHLKAHDNVGNILSTQGGFSLLTLRLYAHYRLECFHEKGMNPISAPFKTEGALSGGIAALDIRGNADIFRGDILYKIELRRFHLATADLKLHNIAYEPLLHLLDYPSDTDTLISGAIDLRGFDRRDVDGHIHLRSQTHRLTPTPILEDDNESFDLRTLLADKFGRIKPFDVNITLDASLAHAGILEQFVGLPLAGEGDLNATLSGDEKRLRLHARTNAAQSDTTLTVNIPDLEPSSVLFDLKHADMEQAFAFFTLPAPISGQGSAFGEFNTTEGKLTIAITKGKTIPKILFTKYQITQPLIRFNSVVSANINEKGVRYRASFKSDLSRMDIDNTTTHDYMLRELLNALR